MDKEDVVCVCARNTDQTFKKEMVSSAATWTDHEMTVLNEAGPQEKNKHHGMSLICGI